MYCRLAVYFKGGVHRSLFLQATWFFCFGSLQPFILFIVLFEKRLMKCVRMCDAGSYVS